MPFPTYAQHCGAIVAVGCERDTYLHNVNFFFQHVSGNGFAYLAMRKLVLNWDDSWIAPLCFTEMNHTNPIINVATANI